MRCMNDLPVDKGLDLKFGGSSGYGMIGLRLSNPYRFAVRSNYEAGCDASEIMWKLLCAKMNTLPVESSEDLAVEIRQFCIECGWETTALEIHPNTFRIPVQKPNTASPESMQLMEEQPKCGNALTVDQFIEMIDASTLQMTDDVFLRAADLLRNAILEHAELLARKDLADIHYTADDLIGIAECFYKLMYALLKKNTDSEALLKGMRSCKSFVRIASERIPNVDRYFSSVEMLYKTTLESRIRERKIKNSENEIAMNRFLRSKLPRNLKELKCRHKAIFDVLENDVCL